MSAPTEASTCDSEGSDALLLLIAPWIPISRSLASVGLPSTWWCISIACISTGGSLCWILASLFPHPIFSMNTLVALPVLVILNAIGPVLAAPSVFFTWIMWKLSTTEDWMSDYHDPNKVSEFLVVAYVCAQILYILLLFPLHQRLHAAREQDEMAFAFTTRSCCYTCCLPCCATANALQRTRQAVAKRAREYADVDELPAYQSL